MSVSANMINLIWDKIRPNEALQFSVTSTYSKPMWEYIVTHTKVIHVD